MIICTVLGFAQIFTVFQGSCVPRAPIKSSKPYHFGTIHDGCSIKEFKMEKSSSYMRSQVQSYSWLRTPMTKQHLSIQCYLLNCYSNDRFAVEPSAAMESCDRTKNEISYQDRGKTNLSPCLRNWTFKNMKLLTYLTNP